MSRLNFVHGPRSHSPLDFSVFTNKMNVEYVSVLDVNGVIVCDYFRILYIEKAAPQYASASSEEYVEWTADPRWSNTKCTKCFSLIGEDQTTDISVIKVDNSIHMLPLYMKWALRVGGAIVDEEGYFDMATYGENGDKLHDTVDKLYQNINGKNRLKNFSEYRCGKCKKEWIEFEP